MSSTLVGEGAAELSSRKKSRGTSPAAAKKARRDARRVAHPAHAPFGEHRASPQDAQTTRSGPETGRRVAARRAGPRALELRRVVTRRGHGRESRGSDAARPRETAKTTRVESVCAEKWYPSSREGAAVGCGAGCSFLEDAATGEQMNVLRETDMVSGEVDKCTRARARDAMLPYPTNPRQQPLDSLARKRSRVEFGSERDLRFPRPKVGHVSHKHSARPFGSRSAAFRQRCLPRPFPAAMRCAR